jgi:predicted deacetylase
VSVRAWATLAILAVAGCSHPSPHIGHVVVAVTIDWEGAAFEPEGLDAIVELRKTLGDAPVTSFVSAAYFTKAQPDPKIVDYLTEAVHKGDELAIHLHAWRSLARASGVEAKLNPSFITGTDKVLEFEDGDAGFDTDLDVYSVIELRSMIRTSRRLLEQTHLPVSKSFRAGGYLGTPKVLQAIREEGFTVDSSATDYRQPDAEKDAFLAKRIQEVWPHVDTTTQPYLVAQLIEMPIAATADYVTVPQMIAMIEAAHARLQQDPTRDVFVVIGFNQETGQDFAKRVGDAVVAVRARPDLAPSLTFATVEHAAELAREQLAR